MANLLSTRAPHGQTVYAIIRNSSAQVWNSTNTAFETWVDANYSNYVVPLTEQGSSGYYYTTLPSSITTADTLAVEYWQGSGAESDLFISGGDDVFYNSTSTSGSSTALTSLSYVKDYGQITVTTWDTFLTNRIYAATSLIQSFTHRTFAQQSYTEVYDGPGADTLMVNQSPLVSVTQLVAQYNTSTPITYTSSQLIFDSAGFVSVAPSSNSYAWFDYGHQNIQVTYTAGYSPIPTDIQEVCAALVMNAYLKMGGGIYQDLTLANEKIGDYQRMPRRDAQMLLTDDLKDALRKYRKSYI